MEFPIAKPSLDSLHSLSPATPKRACSHDLPGCHTTAIESHLALLYRCYNSQVLLLLMFSVQTFEFRMSPLQIFEFRMSSLLTFECYHSEHLIPTVITPNN